MDQYVKRPSFTGPVCLLKTENSILKTIGYFDMFHYPLTVNEICRFLDQPAQTFEVELILQQLVAGNKIFQLGGFYSLKNDETLATRRIEGNKRAASLLATADKIGKRLYKFPFVKGVGISGSLSKNYADENSDIDFFIITATGYLWIARTCLHFLKKLSFITGRQHWYCMNYFIDGEALLISEKNIFTATEVVTLKPVAGDTLTRFYEANQWAFDLFPNYDISLVKINQQRKNPWYKTGIERLCKNRLGKMLDDFLMRLTTKRWQKKENDHRVNTKGEPMGLLTGKHFARPNPEHFQHHVLGMYEICLRTLEDQHELSLADDGYFLQKEMI